MASTYLSRTFGTATNRKIFTISLWFKKATNAANQQFLDTGVDGNNQDGFKIHSSQALKFNGYESGTTYELQSNAVLKDPSGWYNAVVSFDSTQSTSTDRLKMYLNGEEITSFSGATYPSLNFEPLMNKNTAHFIGSTFSNSNYFDGCMSHYHFIDGTAYGASAFGSTDSTTGEWQINTSPSVTYGNNGFFILKNGNSVTDQSGNNNNFTLGGGTLTNTLDCPDNVFNTLNPLENFYSNYTYAQGNTAVASTSSNRTYVTSTLAMPSGKYYWECKLDATIGDSGGASTSVYVGITGQTPISPSQFPSDGTCFNCVMNTNGQVYSNGSTIGSAMGSAWATSTFVMMAYDADNNKMYFGKDGTWLNSGDPTSGATGTGAFTPTTAASATPIGVYMPMWGVDFNASYGTSFNFGNGYFGTTAVASAGTPGSTPGTFEYDVPSGYEPLSTKGLNA